MINLYNVILITRYNPTQHKHELPSLMLLTKIASTFFVNQAQAIGEAASKFIQEDLKMEFVYDYKFHLLREYAKLMRFKPTIPQGAVEICSETMACPQNGPWRQFMGESMVISPKDTPPCTMPSST